MNFIINEHIIITVSSMKYKKLFTVYLEFDFVNSFKIYAIYGPLSIEGLAILIL